MTTRDTYIAAMSRAASSVYIVTTDGPAGRAGVTVSAMTSVAADGEAPTLIVCINDSSSAASPLRENGVFCVNMMADHQVDVANTFASRTPPPGGDKFNACTHAPMISGAPAIHGSLASFDCKIIDITRVATHWVVVGQVIDVKLGAEEDPLVYGMRSYLKLAKAS